MSELSNADIGLMLKDVLTRLRRIEEAPVSTPKKSISFDGKRVSVIHNNTLHIGQASDTRSGWLKVVLDESDDEVNVRTSSVLINADQTPRKRARLEETPKAE